MKRILLCLEPSDDRQTLVAWLSHQHFVVIEDAVESAEFDLCLLDRPALDRCWQQVLLRKQTAAAFLPSLLLSARRDLSLSDLHRPCIDDLIALPIDFNEVQMRLENLLRSRQYSQALQAEIAQRISVRSALSAVRVSETRFQRLFESSVIGIFIADLSGKIFDANDAFLALIGYSPAELHSGQLRWDAITPPEYRLHDQQVVEELRISGIFAQYEKEYFHKNGQPVAVQIGGALLDAENVLCFVFDIGDRKRTETERQQALQQAQELNLLKSRFVSLVSHEFRNPLNVILGTTQLLERYRDWPPARQDDCFRRIKEAVNRMTELLDDVLTVSRVEAGKFDFAPAPLQIEMFCDRLIEEFKLGSGREHRLILTVSGECGQLRLDEKLLRLILSNLIANAIKYSPLGSDVTLELKCQPSAIVFQIRDSGIGIPAEDQPRLFEAFFRAQNVGSKPGTGLGLAIAKQAAELHGGSISVESTANVGTTFTVSLPIL